MLVSNRLSRTLKSNDIIIRAFRTGVVKIEAKTPIQEWGWNYLKRQEASDRPISPHLSIYKPQITWVVSGAHRISGCVMAGALVSLCYPSILSRLSNQSVRWNYPTLSLERSSSLLPIRLSFTRLMGYDLAKGMTLPMIHKTGWLVVGLSAIISLAIVLNSKRELAAKKP